MRRARGVTRHGVSTYFTPSPPHSLRHVLFFSFFFFFFFFFSSLFPPRCCSCPSISVFLQEFKRKFHFLSTQVRQSKSEIEDKNQLIVFEHFNLQNVRDDIEQLETQNSNTFRSLEKGDALIRGQAQQIRKLSTIIADADEELRVQIKQYNSVR